jgi:hypothetical protein
MILEERLTKALGVFVLNKLRKKSNDSIDFNEAISESYAAFNYLGEEFEMKFDNPTGVTRIRIQVNPVNNGVIGAFSQNSVSEKRLDRSSYLTRRRVSYDSNSLFVSCDLKRTPKEGKEKDLNDFIYTHLLIPLMKSVYNW